ncbi:acyl-protein thioesterase [Colletotrichum plurivorum]|uniref:Acyl-protein thioesterase n=1 Tax=Colletotrichum plurivorum TaxID=2175906 RepID=A0A8H6NHT3_9PEZI|nr:acyl-protein thioesterase [Colletotrichum plurivorum]
MQHLEVPFGGETEPPLPLHAFPPPIISPPLRPPHLQTVVFLHGRGSSARIFAPPLLSAPIAAAEGPGEKVSSLREALPHARFVFPTAARSRATVYRRTIINQWYDGSGDWEETVLGHAKETVEFVHELLREEASLVGGADRVVLGGFSQGCAAALVCLLLWEGDPLGGFVGMCGMLPMCGDLANIFKEADQVPSDELGGPKADIGDNSFGLVLNEDHDPFDRDGSQSSASPLSQGLNLFRDEMGIEEPTAGSEAPFRRTPVFLGHGTEDDRVLITHGRAASRTLRMMGCNVEFRSYDGLSHWYSEDMLRHILRFLGGKVSVFGSSGNSDRFQVSDHRKGQRQDHSTS